MKLKNIFGLGTVVSAKKYDGFCGILITDVISGSPSDKGGLLRGDFLLSVNDTEIRDLLDYKFAAADESLEIVYRRGDKVCSATLRNNGNSDDIGLSFGDYLMDKTRRCQNRCIFCFIDRLPTGLRDTLYFKDDDDRLSFLQGNYVTLTNLSRRDIDRIISMRLSVNVSLHTVNPELRADMLGNKHGGEGIAILNELAKSGVTLNIQNVLCPEINDGEELERTLRELTALLGEPDCGVESVAFVPVGVTKHYNENGKVADMPENCKRVRIYKQSEATAVIDIIDKYGDSALDKYGSRTFYPSDEFFVLAERDIPIYEYYSPFFEQYENGVGMWRCFEYEFQSALLSAFDNGQNDNVKYKNVGLVTGESAAVLFRRMFDLFVVSDSVKIFAVRNDFFGNDINVAGLICGSDIVAQLVNQDLPDMLLIPESMLRNEGNGITRTTFLDDMTVDEVSTKLGRLISVLPVDGTGFFRAIAES
ncbi:MAG: DUF512 domain-containing protein [Oscillospiraceae bacterium]|jgi:putative radical SAM enzyme (TIGR03279 family)|nr:DUF512 domain-containing protein [Oscillospiraceae bacterium]